MRYRCILCHAGDSDRLSKTEEAAAKLSNLTGARLLLVHVVEKWHNSELVVTDSKEWQKVHDFWLEEGKELLDKKELQFREAGVKSLKKELRSGEKAYEMITVAYEQYASLMVLTNRQSWLSKLFTSSYRDQLIQHSPCPILWVNE